MRTMVVVLVLIVVVVMTIVRCGCGCGCFVSLVSCGIELVQRYDMRQFGYQCFGDKNKKSVYLVDRCWYVSTVLYGFVSVPCGWCLC